MVDRFCRGGAVFAFDSAGFASPLPSPPPSPPPSAAAAAARVPPTEGAINISDVCVYRRSVPQSTIVELSA